MTKGSRFLTMLLAAIVAFVMLSSVVYVAVEADHDCIGEDCGICHQINTCDHLLKNLSFAVGIAVLAAALTYTLCRAILPCTDIIQAFTLVSLKVKLSD